MKLGDIPVASLSDQDQAMLWNGAGYDIYTYYTGFGWYDLSGTVLSDDVTIPVGGGCWLKSASGGNMVFTKPF
jgi:predicted secreted hydrolase